MKTLNYLIVAGIGAIALAFAPIKDKSTLTISPNSSKIEWRAEKITGSHEGLISLKNGEIQVEDNQVVGGKFIVDMTTIKVTDIEGNSAEKLRGHLNSPDFFNTEKFTEASFVITKVVNSKANEGFNVEINGDLTIKGQTHPVSFPAKIELAKDKFAAYGEITIDRTKYDIKYGSSSFFDNLGDRAIYDEFTLKVSLGAK